MLYFGSFNPAHKGHIALAEYVLEQKLCDEVVLVVSPQSPYKSSTELAPELDRFEMAELACAASRYPAQIKASCVEFLLPKPSYTIDTLRYLQKEHGAERKFSILMGADQLARLDGWKEWESVLAYPVYIYPRQGSSVEKFADRVTVLKDAPLLDISATDIRRRLKAGDDVSQQLISSVIDYIRRKNLWSPQTRIAALTAQMTENSQDTSLYMERGKLHYRLAEWGAALNDFNRVLALDSTYAEARQLAGMVQEIFEFRYKDIYNP